MSPPVNMIARWSDIAKHCAFAVSAPLKLSTESHFVGKSARILELNFADDQKISFSSSISSKYLRRYEQAFVQGHPLDGLFWRERSARNVGMNIRPFAFIVWVWRVSSSRINFREFEFKISEPCWAVAKIAQFKISNCRVFLCGFLNCPIFGNEPRLIRRSECRLRDISALFCCVSGFLSSDSLSRAFSNGFPQREGLRDKGKQLQYSDADESAREDTHPPFGVVLATYLVGLIGGFLIALAGVQQFDGERHFLGAALIGSGVCGAILGSCVLLGFLDPVVFWALRVAVACGA